MLYECLVRIITIFEPVVFINMRKTVRQMIDIIEADGWYFTRQNASHKQYCHSTKKGVVTIPDHGKSIVLDHFVVGSILKQAGLK